MPSPDLHVAETLQERIDALEARVAALEAAAAAGAGAGTRRGSGSSSSAGRRMVSSSAQAEWMQPYVAAELEVSETWIELHEVSARPQLQRLIRQVVDAEGPVTDRLVLDRVRRAWGLRRAGGRVQEAFDQAVRQLIARSLVVRQGDALLPPGRSIDVVRVPGDDESTKRGAEDVPLEELALAVCRVVADAGSADESDATMQVAKLLGWSRRGGAIQERLDAAVTRAIDAGALERSDGMLAAVREAPGAGSAT